MKKSKWVASLLLVAVLFSFVFSDAAYAAKSVAVKSVKLDQSSCSTTVNTCVKLKATVSPSNATDKKISWSSSDTKVAKVDQKGTVSAVGVGTATITAKSSNGKKATCKVTVKEVSVTKVTLDKTSVETLGKTKLTATISPANATNKTLTWSTSNKKVATVDKNGVVTPKGYGTATITVKSANGKQASCTVTVKKDVKIKKSYTVVEANPYKMIDTMVLIVDGKTGKVKSTDCYQTKGDCTFIIGATITGKNIKAYNVQDSYVDFRATWTLSFSVGIGQLKISAGDTVTRTNCYRLHTNGKLEVIDGECSDLLGLC